MVSGDLEEQLNSLDKEERRKLADTIFQWVATRARKKPVPDLQERLNQLQKNLYSMADQLKFEVTESDQINLQVVGSAEHILKELTFGSTWFDGHPRLADFILKAVFDL